MNIPFNDDNRTKMLLVAEALQGTSESLDAMLQTVFEDETLTATDFDVELLRTLDDQVMECQCCNWWCETHELDDDQVCGDCR